jgi:hypothetical protein
MVLRFPSFSKSAISTSNFRAVCWVTLSLADLFGNFPVFFPELLFLSPHPSSISEIYSFQMILLWDIPSILVQISIFIGSHNIGWMRLTKVKFRNGCLKCTQAVQPERRSPGRIPKGARQTLSSFSARRNDHQFVKNAKQCPRATSPPYSPICGTASTKNQRPDTKARQPHFERSSSYEPTKVCRQKWYRTRMIRPGL